MFIQITLNYKPPEIYDYYPIREINDSVDVELFRPENVYPETVRESSIKVPESSKKVPESQILDALSNNERMIINHLLEKKSIRSSDVEELLCVKDSRARKLLNKLKAQDLIIKLGKGKNTYYILSNQ